MKKLLTVFTFLVFAGAVPVQAQEYRVNAMHKQAFIVTVFGRSMSDGFAVGATYCLPKDGAMADCWRNREPKGFVPGMTNGWNTNTKERKYNMNFTHGRFKTKPGRYYLTSLSTSRGFYTPGDVTVFADLAPATVVVFPQQGLSMEQAMTYAKEQMLLQMGEGVNGLKFVPGGAVKLECSADDKTPCKIGKQVDVSKVGFRY